MAVSLHFGISAALALIIGVCLQLIIKNPRPSTLNPPENRSGGKTAELTLPALKGATCHAYMSHHVVHSKANSVRAGAYSTQSIVTLSV